MLCLCNTMVDEQKYQHIRSDIPCAENSGPGFSVVSALDRALLVDAFLVAFFVVFRRSRASASLGSSFVLNAELVLLWKSRRSFPSKVVYQSSISNVRSVCRRSFAKACQWANTKRRSSNFELCGSGIRPSKTGMAHYSKYKMT